MPQAFNIWEFPTKLSGPAWASLDSNLLRVHRVAMRTPTITQGTNICWWDVAMPLGEGLHVHGRTGQGRMETEVWRGSPVPSALRPGSRALPDRPGPQIIRKVEVVREGEGTLRR